jgi:uncharacterized protein (TIGR03435 family)
MLYHLWQSTLFAAVPAFLTLALRKNHARTRHWMWLAASMKFLLPFSLLVSAGRHVRWADAPAASVRVAAAARAINGVISQPFETQIRFNTPAAAAVTSTLLPFVWLCGFAAVLIFWYVRWRRVQSVVRMASPIELGAPIRTMSSPALLEPGVFGIFRPLLLLPEGIVERLTARQLRAIIDHELCHVRRRDNLAAAIHMLVESIFWFHPLVWWIGARLVDERERACDEEVLRRGSEPEVYAEGILNVCKFYVESPVSCVSGVTGSDLKKRIEGIMTHRIVRNISAGKKLLLATVGIAAVILPIAIGVLNAQSPTARPQFEVASIKLNTSGLPGGLFGSKSPGTFNVVNLTLREIIAAAWRINSFQLTGGPGWIGSAHYDITAKPKVGRTPGPLPPLKTQADEMALMAQSLLEDRFQLKVHRETKELPVYALTVAKGGPKVHEGACTTYDPNNPPARPAPGEKRPDFCGNISMGGNGPNRTIDGFGITMAEFAAKELPFLTGRVVIDKTGLAGKFNLHLELSADEVPNPGEPGDRERAAAAADSTGPSLFTALEEQLGLKLESTKGPVEVLVIDHLEKPSEN